MVAMDVGQFAFDAVMAIGGGLFCYESRRDAKAAVQVVLKVFDRQFLAYFKLMDPTNWERSKLLP